MGQENGTIEVADMEMTQEQVAEIIEMAGAVNFDEVTNEYVSIKVSESRDVDAVDDQGNPLLDDQGNPLKNKEFYTRTAKIYDLVPLPLYNQMVKLRDQIQTKKISQQEAVAPMGDLVYEVWKLSEPWMTQERFLATVHGETIGALFVRFFNKSRLKNNKAQLGGGTTSASN